MKDFKDKLIHKATELLTNRDTISFQTLTVTLYYELTGPPAGPGWDIMESTVSWGPFIWITDGVPSTENWER